LLLALLLLGVISFVVFSLLYLAPGSPELLLVGLQNPSPEVLHAIREQYHLNDPFVVQYFRWLGGAVRLDFGVSIRTREPVLPGILRRLGTTVDLGVMGFVITMTSGIVLGVIASVKRRSFIDRLVVGLSVMGVSTPAFVTAVLLLFVFAVALGWFPASGIRSGALPHLWSLTLPALAFSLRGLGLVLKLTRASMVEELERDYVVFARARGLTPGRILLLYALRNALVPVVTAGGLILGDMIAAAILVEVVFALPGAGALLVTSVSFKDIPMVQGLALTIAAFVILANLLTDLLYLFIDPRIRFGGAA
jgi:peptide/nickel transport system permease protein